MTYSIASISPAPWSRRDWIALVLLMTTVIGLYARTAGFDFVDYDDSDYVFGNPNVTGGITMPHLHAAWITYDQNWHPLTMMGLMLIDSCFGTRPGPFHIANFLLHTINTGLLFVFLRKSTGRFWLAVFSAALWGWHPLRVESVAWISEFKDVLCGCMWLLCMLAYLRYARQRTVGRYAIVAMFLALSLMAKPMAVTLPVALLLLDYWPLRQNSIPAQSRWRWWMWRTIEKLPLLGLSLAAIASALVSQQSAMGSASHFSVFIRLQNAVVSIAAYVRDSFWPAGLAFFYPHPAMLGRQIAPATFAAGIVLIGGITMAAVFFRRKSPAVSVGWFWFVLTLLPVLGLVQVGEQSRADRYTYIPSIAWTAGVVWLIGDLIGTARISRGIAVGIGVLSAIAMGIVTTADAAYWRDSVTLFTRADQAVPDNFLTKALLASELRAEGHHGPAMKLATDAAALSPRAWAPRFYLGLLLMDEKRFDEASRALSVTPMPAQNWYALGLVSSSEADQCLLDSAATSRAAIYEREACDCLRRSLAINSNNPPAADLLAQQLDRLGETDRAVAIWTDLTRQSPGYGPGHGHLADALFKMNRVPESLPHYRAAIALGERNPSWETTLAFQYATGPQPPPMDLQELVAIATDARDQTGGKNAAALDALAAILARAGRIDNAIAIAQSAITQAESQRNTALADGIRKRLGFYQAGRPYSAGD